MYENDLASSLDYVRLQCGKAPGKRREAREPGPEGAWRAREQGSAPAQAGKSGKHWKVSEYVKIAFSEARERLGVSTDQVEVPSRLVLKPITHKSCYKKTSIYAFLLQKQKNAKNRKSRN
jgi:hypothetical protein